MDLDAEDLVLRTLGEWLELDLSYLSTALAMAVPPESALVGVPEAITLYPGYF